jgi:hypothetical protein
MTSLPSSPEDAATPAVARRLVRVQTISTRSLPAAALNIRPMTTSSGSPDVTRCNTACGSVRAEFIQMCNRINPMFSAIALISIGTVNPESSPRGPRLSAGRRARARRRHRPPGCASDGASRRRRSLSAPRRAGRKPNGRNAIGDRLMRSSSELRKSAAWNG